MAEHVRLFLTQNDLGIYADRFIEEGFDNMTSLLDITESDLAELNVKLGHRRRLQRLIAYQKALSYFDPIPINNNSPLTPPPSHNQLSTHFPTNTLPSTSATNINISNSSLSTSNMNSYTQSSINSINASLTSPKKKIGKVKQLDMSSNPSSTNFLLFHQNQVPNQGIFQHQNSLQYPHPFLHHSIPTPASSTSSSSITNSNIPQSGSFNHHPLFIFTDLMDNSSKRKYKRHPKPDAMAPVKPLSAYVQFCQDVREELKAEYGKEKFEMMSFNEISQEVGQRWRKLDPDRKAELEKIAEQKKKEYDEALKVYEQSENFRKYQLYLIAWHAQQRSQGKKTALDEKFDKKRKRNVEKSQEKSNTNQTSNQISYNNQIPHMSYIPTPALSLPINNALLQNNLIKSSNLNPVNSSPSFYSNLMMYSPQDEIQQANALLLNNNRGVNTSNNNNNSQANGNTTANNNNGGNSNNDNNQSESNNNDNSSNEASSNSDDNDNSSNNDATSKSGSKTNEHPNEHDTDNSDNQNNTNTPNHSNLLNTSNPLKDNKLIAMLGKHPLSYNSSNHLGSILPQNSQNPNLTFQPNLQSSLVSLKPTITHYDGQVAVRPPSTPIQNTVSTTAATTPSYPLILDQNPTDLVQTLFQPVVQLPSPINISSNFPDSSNTIINSHTNYSSYSNQNPLSLTPHLFTNSAVISPTSVRNLSLNRIRPNSVNFINNRNRKRVKR